MSKIEDLISEIADPRLREEIAGEVAALKKQKKFGLVFEDHIPEQVQLPGLPVKEGLRVVRRGGNNKEVFLVEEVFANGKARIRRDNGDAAPEPETVKTSDLVIIKRFGEPVYPALVPVARLTRAPGKPYHTLINADNFHALQLLLYCYAGQVDVIYIDPPYNTGARDWKYNNDYVDSTDEYRHSKWLSMVKKRLRLAKRLLNPYESVLVVTIDEKEYLHLGMLLEEEFPGANIQMVSTLVNPANVAREGAFGRNDEYIFFVMIGGAAPQKIRLEREWVSAKGRTHTGNIRWDLLRRSGPGSARQDSPGCFYPIYVNPVGPAVAEIGDAVPEGEPVPEPPPGCVTVLPIRKNRTEGRWQWTPATIRQRLPQGRVRITGSQTHGYVVSVLKDGEYSKILRGEFNVSGRRPDGSLIVNDIDPESVVAVPGSQWRISSHDATQYGSRLLANILPDATFPFPKSLYAVEDALRFFVQHKPNALILDFFAGSGTTYHATAMLNSQHGGNRQCVLVTNNEVTEKLAKQLKKEGLFPGDPEFEKHGICEAVTWLRCKYATRGQRDDRTPLPGTYLDGGELKEGFEENIEYFKLDFLHPHEVAYGEKFEAILPILWLMAGAKGERETARGYAKWFIPKESPFAVLIREEHFADFRRELEKRPDIAWVFLVTDSEEAYREMVAALPGRPQTKMLYKSYLDNFRINTEKSL